MPRIPYDPNYLCFITTVTHQRQPLFRDVRLAERLGTMIHMACRLKGFVPLTYAILPDHIHLLICSQQLVERTLESVRSTAGNNLARVEGGLFPPRYFWVRQAGSRSAVTSPPDATIGSLMQSIKGTFSRTLNAGSTWQQGYFCWYVTDVRDVTRTADYIIHNYQKTHLPLSFGQEPYVWCDTLLIGKLLS